MRVLHTLKLPLMLFLSVGGVWVAAWESTLFDPTKRQVVLPASEQAKKLTANVRRAAIERGETVVDAGDLYH